MLKKCIKRGVLLLGGFLLLGATFASTIPVSAATANSIYSYTFDGSASTVANAADANSGVDLTLTGDWTQSAFGVHFAGDTVAEQSVAYGRPSGSDTLNVAANESVGIAAKFTYEGLPTGEHCFEDSRNIAQIGRFGEGLSQVKIQISNCSEVTNTVFPQCRFAGQNSTTDDAPMASSQPLIKGQSYIIRCYKTPDPGTGSPTLNIEVTQINMTYGHRTTLDTHAITPTGIIQSTAYLSVANKYQLPTQENNTDQFVGDVAKVAFCQAGTTAAVDTCLDTEVPDPVVTTPIERQWVTNPGVETDLTQWEGRYGSNVNVDVSRSTAEAYTGSASIKVLGLTGASNHNSGFSDDEPRLVTNATIGEAYNGSVWVKPSAVGQKINFRLREWSGNTMLADNKVTLTAASTNWQQMTNSITATQNGTRIAFIVQAEDIDAGEYFYADDMSLDSELMSHDWVSNGGIETDLIGWGGTYNSSAYIDIARSTAEARTGSASIKVNALTGAVDLNSGFADSPRWVKATMEAGKTYRGSVWVKPSAVGQQITLRLREWKWNQDLGVSQMHGDDRKTFTAASTNWQKLEMDLTASENDSDLSFLLYGMDMDAGEYFYADDLSITSLE